MEAVVKIRKNITCPLELVHDIIKGKWKPVIIWQINYWGKASLAQLEEDIKGASQKMILEQLKELMEYEIIEKIVHKGYPLKVEYCLTENKGKKILRILELMQALGKEYMEEPPQKSG